MTEPVDLGLKQLSSSEEAVSLPLIPNDQNMLYVKVCLASYVGVEDWSEHVGVHDNLERPCYSASIPRLPGYSRL